jgi:hypothetical protein
MPPIDDFLTEISGQLQQAVALNLTRRSAACDIFEAYVFAIVLDAATRESANIPIQLEDTTGRPSSAAVFRTSPGRIYPSSPSSPPYTHAIVQFADKPALEVHQGIYISGKSGLLHECDVAVLLRSEGQTCRQNRVHPRCAKVIFGSECKFYGAGLGIGLARGFLGLTTDIWKHGRFFVSNSASDASRKLLTHHDRKWAEGVVPNASNVTNRFRALIERVFEEFKASN